MAAACSTRACQRFSTSASRPSALLVAALATVSVRVELLAASAWKFSSASRFCARCVASDTPISTGIAIAVMTPSTQLTKKVAARNNATKPRSIASAGIWPVKKARSTSSWRRRSAITPDGVRSKCRNGSCIRWCTTSPLITTSRRAPVRADSQPRVTRRTKSSAYAASKAAPSAIMRVVTASALPRPITRLSTVIMKSGVARPSTLIRNELAASFRITGRTLAASGACQSAAAPGATGRRSTRARAPSARTFSAVVCQTRPSTTSSTVQCAPRPDTTTCAVPDPATIAKGAGNSSRGAAARSSALASRPIRAPAARKPASSSAASGKAASLRTSASLTGRPICWEI